MRRKIRIVLREETEAAAFEQQQALLLAGLTEDG
jgi:hypothetical protein